MLIAIDHGNSRIKTVDNSFVSGYAKFDNEPPMAKDVIRYGGSYYALTETRLFYQFDKTGSENFYILTLFAIAKEIEVKNTYQPEMDIELAVGLPPVHFGLLKQKFTDYLSRERQTVSFEYNGKPFSIKITRVFVFPQAFAAIAAKLTEYQKMPCVIVVDIGGFTVDTLMLRHGNLDMKYCMSLEMGIIPLCDEAEQKGIAKCGYAVEPGDVDDILLHRCTLREEIQSLVRGLAVTHVNDIIDQLREKRMDICSQPVVFLGGGSNILRETIIKTGRIPADNATFISNGNANAYGYYVIAKSMLDKEKQSVRS